VCFASMLKFIESQNLLEFQKLNGQTAALRTPVNELFITQNRTGVAVKIPVSAVSSLSDICHTPL